MQNLYKTKIVNQLIYILDTNSLIIEKDSFNYINQNNFMDLKKIYYELINSSKFNKGKLEKFQLP